MDAGEVRTRTLTQFGIRIEPAMSRYVLRQLQERCGDSFPIMGGDARTGIPVRRFIPAAAFDQPIHSPESLIS
ncbi:MAG TPA: hypothetical protein VGR35_18225 [Tepidisphaeraceae bacterium]|nr:hypothetical protein [Tepidisphaeraceae bacterium]